jgi:carbamoyl-phosphate synthase large subunit
MRSTGEVMASAADYPTALAKAERAAGRPLPSNGGVLSSATGTRKAVVPVAAALAIGFSLAATSGTARVLAAAGLVVDHVRKVTEPGEGATVVDLLRRGRCDLVVNTPQGSGARTDGYRIRDAALVARIPCITTVSGAAAAVHAIAHARGEAVVSLQERIDAQARPVASSRPSPLGRTRSCASSGATSSRAFRASSSCSKRPAVCCRGR